jgi:hypothetical protein
VLTVSPEDLGVVPGRHRVEAEATRSFEEEVELDVSIAFDARIGRATREVPLDEGSNDVALELLGIVEDVVVNAERLGDAARVLDVSDRAATRVRDAAPQLQGCAHDLVTLLQQQAGGRR